MDRNRDVPDRFRDVRFRDVRFRDVIVPVDGTASAARVLELGARIAGVTAGTLQVVCYPARNDVSSVAEVVSEQVAAVDKRFGVATVLTVAARTETVAEHILGLTATSPDALVCAATHGRTRTAAYFGSVTTELIKTNSVAALLCGPRWAPADDGGDLRGPIALPVDGPCAGPGVLAAASRWSATFSEPIQQFHVDDPGLGRTERCVNVARGIIDEALVRHASVIAMATHAPTGSQRFWNPSVASEVIKRSPRPVLAVLATTADLPEQP